MNWPRVLIAGVAGGIVATIANFIMHGVIMGNAYTKYSAFSQEAANPLYFVLIGLCVGLMTAVLFARTRSAWGAGAFGGLTFGFFVGLVFFFPPFYNSLVIDGFPYHMSWCWGGIDMIQFLVLGTVLGAVYKESGSETPGA